MTYLTDELEQGMWYVSEGFISFSGPVLEDEINNMIRHNTGAHQMVLAGPYNSKEDAESNVQQFAKDFISPYVWLFSQDILGNAG